MPIHRSVPKQSADAAGEGAVAIYEMRRYRAMPGRPPVLLKRFETRTLKIWDRIGIRQDGFWTNVISPSHLELFYILIWDSKEERQRKWDAFMADPEGIEALAQSERDGLIIANVESSLRRPTSFSPLQ